MLSNEMTEIDFAASLHPFCERTDSAAADHKHDWLAGCWVDNRFLLQVRHLAALGFDVTVADIVASQWGFSRDHADF